MPAMCARHLTRLIPAVVLAAGLVPARDAVAQQTSMQMERAIGEALERERDLRQLEVSVLGTEAILRGPVPHLFAKNLAIEIALAADGIETVASEIDLPESEDPQEVVDEVVRAIQGYPHHTMWDHVEGRFNEGVVTLSGSVTPDRDKKGELYERIAKIRGVQDYNDDALEVQSTSREDERLRSAIARNLFRSEHFERFRSMTNPPFHIVVNRSIVTLVGYVQGQIEYREMERIVGATMGVLRVDNRLEALN